jgi:peptidoglycan DL-endopeptidase CwlO
LEQEIAAAQARMTNTSLDGAAIIEIADNYGGVPYVRGGTTPKGFDCSGYTSYVFRQLGVELPRTSAQQAKSFGLTRSAPKIAKSET